MSQWEQETPDTSTPDEGTTPDEPSMPDEGGGGMGGDDGGSEPTDAPA